MQAPTFLERQAVLDHPPGAVRILCASCEHSEFVHGDLGSRRCLYTVCDCSGFARTP